MNFATGFRPDRHPLRSLTYYPDQFEFETLCKPTSALAGPVLPYRTKKTVKLSNVAGPQPLEAVLRMAFPPELD